MAGVPPQRGRLRERIDRLAYHVGTLLLVVIVNLSVGAPWQWLSAHNDGMELGVNFSCRRAQALVPDTDCDALFAALLDDLGATRVRLAIYWDELEPERGRFDFGQVDRFIAAAEERGVTIVPILGMKSTYRPEFYLPAWLEAGRLPPGTSPADDAGIAAATLAMLTAAVEHLAPSDAIEAWQVENEPDVHPDDDTSGWSVPDAFLAREIAAVRAADPRHRPVIVTDDTSQFWQRGWIRLLGMADGIGLSFYTRRPDSMFPGEGQSRRFDHGALGPDIWHQVTRAHLEDRRVWIVELQAEPWQNRPVEELRPDDIISISPGRMRDNVALARRTGADRAYLWGAEWWWYMRERWDEPAYWETARELLAEGG